ncbi:hypothetical protein SLS58_009412 [Diplodia intermedia]|uniref:Uncharacterized protein n=1 Tax=Diplodia intermedia TaxID=856260 RepID=A0ABR3TCF7_9PEZI
MPADEPMGQPAKSSRKINWMSDKDMLPHTLPKANIIGYGLDLFCASRKVPPNISLETLVSNISKDIIAFRKTRPQKPIIFIGHGYGSIVIDKILFTDSRIKGDERKDWEQLQSATAAVILFGAPLLNFTHLKSWFDKNVRLTYSGDINTYFESASYKLDYWRRQFKEATNKGISILAFSEQTLSKEEKVTSNEGKAAPKEEPGSPKDQKHVEDREILESWEEIAELCSDSDIASVVLVRALFKAPRRTLMPGKLAKKQSWSYEKYLPPTKMDLYLTSMSRFIAL